MSSPIDLSQLPAPAIVETLDYEAILTERKAYYLSLFPIDEQTSVARQLALESDPVVKLLQENAYRETVLRQRVNEAAKAVMLAFAGTADLDQIGANYKVERLVIDEGDADAVPPIAPTYESDTKFRERIQLSFERLSVAGPEGAYLYHARSADGRVLDASAYAPLKDTGLPDGRVIVTILARDNAGIPSEDLLDLVTTVLNDEDVRPLTDKVIVQPATLVDYDVSATIYTLTGPDRDVVLAEARARLDTYVADRRLLGRDVTLSGLYRALHANGVQRVVLESPLADVVVDRTQATRCTAIGLTFGGVDE